MLNRLFANANLLEKGLDASWKKNEVIANNIANIDTPGFKRSDVEFESVFRNELSSGENSFFNATNSLSKEFKNEIVKSDFKSTNADKITGSVVNNNLAPKISQSTQASIKMDQNSVDIDYEMTELAKKSILYESLTYSISKEIGRIKYIIKEGR